MNSLSFKITLAQKELIAPLGDLQKKVSVVYKQFSQDALCFDQMLRGSAQDASNVFSYGALIINKLQESLHQWQQRYGFLHTLVSENGLHQALEKMEPIYYVPESKLCVVTVETDELIDQSYHIEKCQEPLTDLYQEQILKNLHRLRWQLFQNWKRSLDQVIHYNRLSLQNRPTVSLQKTVYTHRNPLPSASSRLFLELEKQFITEHSSNELFSQLSTQLQSYANVFGFTHLQERIEKALLPITQVTQRSYRNIISKTQHLEGASPENCVQHFNQLIATLQHAITQHVEMTKKEWQMGLESNRLTGHTRKKEVNQPLLDYLQNPKGLSKLLRNARKTYFPPRSLLYHLEDGLCIYLKKIDREVEKLVYNFFQTIYLYNCSQNISILNKHFNLDSTPSDFNENSMIVDTVRVNNFIETIKDFYDTLLKHCFLPWQDQIKEIFRIQAKSYTAITVNDTTALLLRQISGVRKQLISNYYNTQYILSDFSEIVRKNCNILQSGLAREEDLASNFDFTSYRSKLLTISKMLDSPFNERRALPKKKYWITENISTEKSLAYGIIDEQLKVKERFKHTNVSGMCKTSNTVSVLHVGLLSSLLELVGKTDNMFYRCIELLHHYPDGLKKDAAPIRSMKSAVDQLVNKVNQLEEFEYKHYTQLFDISDDHRLTLMNQLINLKEIVSQSYSKLNTYQVNLFTNNALQRRDQIKFFITQLESLKSTIMSFFDESLHPIAYNDFKKTKKRVLSYKFSHSLKNHTSFIQDVKAGQPMMQVKSDALNLCIVSMQEIDKLFNYSLNNFYVENHAKFFANLYKTALSDAVDLKKEFTQGRDKLLTLITEKSDQFKVLHTQYQQESQTQQDNIIRLYESTLVQLKQSITPVPEAVSSLTETTEPPIEDVIVVRFSP